VIAPAIKVDLKDPVYLLKFCEEEEIKRFCDVREWNSDEAFW